MKFTALMFVAVATAPSFAAAQSTASAWPPAVGSRVRLTAVALGGKRETGILVSANKDSVSFRPASLDNSVSFRTADVTHLEVSQGTHTRKAKGALLGFLIVGGITGGLVAATWDKDHTGFIDFGRWGDAAIVGGELGLLGALVGTIVGSRATESWHTVSVPRNQ